jgi:ABC-2 type transport system permease protein
LQVLLVLCVGAWLFGVPIEGSLGLLFGAALLFLLGMLGQGLLVSVVTRNQQLATLIGMLSSLLPTLLLSGFIFPIENMPWLLQLISAVVPGRYFIVILRGILLKGNGMSVLWPQLLALGLFAAIMIAMSTARFQRRVD